MSQFAPTPLHGAAYSRVLDAIGGPLVVGNCSDGDKYNQFRARLDEVLIWSGALEQADAREAYQWGVNKVDADLRARLAIFDNSRAVLSALSNLPSPPPSTGSQP